MPSTPRIFISATTKGLHSYREAVRDELLRKDELVSVRF